MKEYFTFINRNLTGEEYTQAMDDSAESLLSEDMDPMHAGNEKKQTYITCLPINWINQNSKRSRNSPLSTIFLLLNSMIGSGILAQPYVFRKSGTIFLNIK